MMITTEVDFSATTTKPEGNAKAAPSTTHTTTSSSSSWTRLKDPRIVRVSRAFGGKDRHSKVCTVRGLRDRRVRLSVPTAIQLYDLQDRLGLNQPSKVVDWLLNAAKNEIDELPPLQLPPAGNFNPNLQQWLCSAASQAHSSKEGLPPEPSSSLRAETEGDNGDEEDDDSQDGKQQPLQQTHHGGYHHQPNNLLLKTQNSSPLPNLLNSAAQFNSFLRWDPSSLSLSHGGAVSVPQPDQDFHSFNVLPHSFFHRQRIGGGGGGGAEFEPRQINFQMLSSGSQHPSPLPIHDFTSHSLRPLHFLASHNNPSGSQPNKENEFHSS